MAKSVKAGGSGKSGSSGKVGSLFAGILLGMILGLAAAGGVAWYILKKSPASFESKERHETVKPEVEKKAIPPVVVQVAPASTPVAVAQSATVAASAVGETKQHFEFYKVLTDKPDGAAQNIREKPVATIKENSPAPVIPSAASAKEKYYVQAGSFPSAEDAEKLKAKLALLGMEASVQTAVIPDRGTYHRVRLGPIVGSEELNKTLALLKQNGVTNATPIKAQ